jgi:hypothetical protein
VQPYFVLRGNICALLATKDHATAKAVQIYRGDAINRDALLEMFRGVIAHNRAGGWRRIQA